MGPGFVWKVLLALVAGLVLSLDGCVMEDHKPGQDFAMEIVWRQQYNQLAGEFPVVYWVNAAQLNCDDGQGWNPGIPNTPSCVAGLTYQDPPMSFVAWPADTEEFSETSFAHELCHRWSYLATGDADGAHLGPCFNPPGSYVAIANDALGKVGL